jgi:hypothetical protein
MTNRRIQKKKAKRAAPKRKWSQKVTEQSDALDLQKGVFTRKSARAVAESLKQSADHAPRAKSSPFRAAMSMLTFYLNRAGSTLSAVRKRTLGRAKEELRKLYGRWPHARPT